MATIPSNYIIQAEGEYEIPGLVPGLNYLLTLKGDDPTGGTATVAFNNGPDGVFYNVDDPDMLGSTGITERRFQAPSGTMQITLGAGFGEPIKVSIVESKR